MVRLTGSPKNRQFAVTFVCAMSVRDNSSKLKSIGRSGENMYTVHDLLRDCYPQAARGGAKDGVSSCEMNKALEKEGFEPVRVRQKKCTETADRARTDIMALYRFKNRRWLDPDDPHDLQALSASWCALNKIMRSKLSFQEFCQHTRQAVEADNAFLRTHPRSMAALKGNRDGREQREWSSGAPRATLPSSSPRLSPATLSTSSTISVTCSFSPQSPEPFQNFSTPVHSESSASSGLQQHELCDSARTPDVGGIAHDEDSALEEAQTGLTLSCGVFSDSDLAFVSHTSDYAGTSISAWPESMSLEAERWIFSPVGVDLDPF